MIALDFLARIGKFFRGGFGAAMRERDAVVPKDDVKEAGYFVTIDNAPSWPFNENAAGQK